MRKIFVCILLSFNAVLYGDEAVRERPSINSLVAIIETATGTGTGFLIREENAIWLYSNEHVVRGGSPLRAKLMNGSPLKLTALQLAPDRDAVRIKVDGSYTALRIAAVPPEIGSEVNVVGNSDGAGVGTLLNGRVLGVGPNEVEVSASFVPGNSGSPIIAQGGDVVGVATYITRGKVGSDWTKAGTRFEQIRRFGVRVDGVKWIDIGWKDYARQAQLLTSVNAFIDVMYFACFSEKMALTEYPKKWQIKGISHTGVAGDLRMIEQADKAYIMCLDKMSRSKSDMKNIGFNNSSAYYNETTLQQYSKKYQKEYLKAAQDSDRKWRDLIHQRQLALKSALRRIKQGKWATPHLQQIAESYQQELKAMLEQFEKDFRQSLGYFHD